MEIAPVFGGDFETVRVSRYFDSFIIDLWFKSEDISDIEISSDDIKDIGYVIGTDLQEIFRKAATPGSALVSMKDIDVDYGLYFIKVRSVYFGKDCFDIKADYIDGIGEKIESDFSGNADKIVEEINSKKSLNENELEMIEKQLFKPKK